MVELAKIAADAMLTDLRDEKKATYRHLSSSRSKYSWKGCSEESKQALLGHTATNDEAKSALGGATSQLQRFGRIKLSSGAAISDMQRNSFIQRAAPGKYSKNLGLFHQFDEQIWNATIQVEIEVSNVSHRTRCKS